MHLAALALELSLPGCTTLKQKRSRLKPLLTMLHREFNVSASEIEHLDHHSLAVIACAVVSNDAAHNRRVLDGIPAWIESHRPDVDVIDSHWSTW
jgi:uncharacterized protein YlxP (DUF503 family)